MEFKQRLFCVSRFALPLPVICLAVHLCSLTAGAEELPPPPVEVKDQSKTPLNEKSKNKESEVPSYEDLLEVYLTQIASAYLKYPREDQKKILTEVLNSARTKYTANQKDAKPSGKTILANFEDLLDMIDNARAKLRRVQDDKVLYNFAQEAARSYALEVKAASDISTRTSGQKWFEDFLGMMEQIRTRTRFNPELTQALYGVIGPKFSDVLKSIKLEKGYGTPESRYESNLRLVRTKFPTRNSNEKSANDRAARMLEAHAQNLFKLENVDP